MSDTGNTFGNIIGARSTTANQKKQILWNMLQPGDPYDIKKSLIAKLPGDKRMFMGDNIQMVCLFQAAEIQRLIESLDEYKFRYKQLERRQLDRHSYQIQIKELAQKSLESEQLKQENIKLKEFIRKQTNELQEWKKKSSELDLNLQKKYQNALKQIQSMYYQNNNFKSENQNLKNEIISLRGRLEGLDRTRSKEIQQLRITMQNQRKSMIEKQIRDINYKFSIQRNQLEGEIRRFRQMIESKNRQMDDLKVKMNSYINQINDMNQKNNQVVNLTKKINEYQSKFVMMSEQIERLNRVLKQKTIESNELNKKTSAYEQELILLNKTISQLQNQLSDNKKLIEYENKMALLSQQLERINSVLKSKVVQLTNVTARNNKLEYEYENLKKSIEQINLIKANYQNRIAIMRQQNQRLKEYQQKLSIYLKRQQQFNRKMNEFQIIINRLQKQNRDLSNELKISSQRQSSRFINEINDLKQKINILQQNNFNLKKQNENIKNQYLILENNMGKYKQVDKRIIILTTEKQRILEDLRIKTNQLKDITNKFNDREREINQRFLQYQNQIKNLNQDVRRSQVSNQIINRYEFTIKQVQDQNQKLILIIKSRDEENSNWQIRYNKLNEQKEQLNRIAHELQNTVRELNQQYSRIHEYENKIAFLSQEIQRLNYNLKDFDRLNITLKSKSEQVNNLQRAFNQISEENNNLKISFHQNFQKLEYQLQNRLLEIEDLRRKLAQANDINKYTIEYQNKINLFKQEFQRLNEVVRLKVEQCTTWQSNYNRLVLQHQELNRIAHQLQGRLQQIGDWEQRSNEYQIKIDTLIKQNNLFRGRISELSSVQKKINEYELRFTSLTSQIQRLNGIIKVKNQQFTKLKNENDELKFKINDMEKYFSDQINSYEFKISIISQENQKYRIIVENKDLQWRKAMQLLQEQFSKNVSRQNQEYRNLEMHYKNLEFEFNSLKNSGINKQQYENKVALLSQQIKRLNQVKDQQNNEIYGLKNHIQQITRSFNIQINNSQNQMNGLSKHIQNLQRIIKQLQNNCTQYQSKCQMYSHQIQRLNKVLKIKIDQTSIEITNVRNKYSMLNEEYENYKRRTASNQQTINKLRNQNDQLRKNLSDFDSVNERITILTNQNKNYILQIQNLEQNIRLLTNQINTITLQKTKIIKQYESRITTIRFEYQNKSSGVYGEIDRLNIIIKNFQKENQRLVSQNQDNSRAYVIQKTSLLREIEQLKLRFQKTKQIENMLNKISRQNNILNQQIISQQNKLRQYQMENGRINQQLIYLRENYKNIVKQNESLKANFKDLDSIKYRQTEYLQKITNLNIQIQRLNNLIKSKNQQILIIERNYKQITIEKQTIISDNNKFINQRNQLNNQRQQFLNQKQKLLIQIENLNITISQYQNKYSMSSRQIERLNQILRKKVDEIANLQKLLSQQSDQKRKINILMQENEQLKKKLTIDIQAYERRILTISNQNQRLKVQITEITRKRNQDFQYLNKQKSQYQNRIALLSQEVQRLNIFYKTKLEQSSDIQSKYDKLVIEYNELKYIYQDTKRKLQQTLQRYDSEFKIKINSYEQRFNQLNLQNQHLRRRIVELDSLNRRYYQYENKFNNLNQENERLNNELRIKTTDLQNIDTRYQKLLTQYNSKISSYEQRFNMISGQNDQLKLKLKDFQNYTKRIQQYQNKVALLSQQIERLTSLLATKSKQLSDIRSQSQFNKKRFQELNLRFQTQINTRIQVINQQNDTYKRKILEYESRHSTFTYQIEKLNETIRSRTEENRNLQTKFKQLNTEFTQINRKYKFCLEENESLKRKLQQANLMNEQHLSGIIQQNNQLKRKIYELQQQIRRFSEYESKMTFSQQQIERLNGKLKMKTQQADEISQKYKILNAKYKEIQVRLSSFSQEYEKLQQSYQFTIKEYELSKRKVQQHEQKVIKLSSQFQKLNKIIQDLRQQNYNLKVEIGKFQTLQEKNRKLAEQIQRLNKIKYDLQQQISQLRIRFTDSVALEKRINEHLSLFVVLFAQIESLRKRVKDKEREVEDVRRSSLAPFKV